MNSNEDNQDSFSHPASATGYIEGDSGQEIDAAFAGNLPGNLKRIEDAFGVTLIARDSWIKIESGDEQAFKRDQQLSLRIQSINTLFFKKDLYAMIF